MECDFERLPTVTTRSGRRAARLGTAPPLASPAYTSSETSHRSWPRASSAITLNSASFSTTPLGLFGVAQKIARVRGVMSAASAARSGRQPAAAGTRTRRAPDTSMVAG